MIVTLESVKNPDHKADYNRAIKASSVEVKDLKEAQTVCRQFIKSTGIGGGNWTGGDVYEDGVQIARISYNCRVWTPEARWSDRKEIEL